MKDARLPSFFCLTALLKFPVKVDTTLNAANIVNGATPERLYIIKDAMIWYQREVEQFRYDLAG